MRSRSVLAGLLICIARGVLAPMMNFGLAYGAEIATRAKLAGAGANHVVDATRPALLLGKPGAGSARLGPGVPRHPGMHRADGQRLKGRHRRVKQCATCTSL